MPRSWLTSLWPARLCLAGILAIKAFEVLVVPPAQSADGIAWTFAALLILAIALVTAAGAWAFRRSREVVWLAGAMAAALAGVAHPTYSAPGALPPVIEQLAPFAVGLLLLTASVFDRDAPKTDPA
ncbi:MAG: hypothetical protein KTR31_14280 [Myxococcales bacterium]|nr:hypothetical protein [Myxococcales bacterium]